MPIIIKKRHVVNPIAPAPLVQDPPITQAEAPQSSTKLPPAPTKAPADNPPPVRELRLATSLADYWDNRSQVYLPEFRACTKCKHSYPFPCDGKSKTCANVPAKGK